MNDRLRYVMFAICLLSFAAVGLSGCVWVGPPLGEMDLGPTPGTYYVEQQEGKLEYYELPDVRGADGRWIELDDEGVWFTVPGFYRLSEDYVWSRDASAEGLTLDDFIQLHDPPPVPGEAP